jgi:hypothetical protein
MLVFAWIFMTVLAGSMWLVDMQPGFKESAGFGAAQTGMTVGAIVSFLVVMQRTLTNRRRAAERYVMPLLLRALSAVHPTQEELEQAMETLRERKIALARVWDAQRLYDRLELVPGPLPLRWKAA